MRFFTCGVPVEQDDDAASAPTSFEAGFSAIKAQVRRYLTQQTARAVSHPNPCRTHGCVFCFM